MAMGKAVMADDERRAEIEAKAAKALRAEFGRLGILSRAVVYHHPSGEEIARVVLDVADRVRDARGDNEVLENMAKWGDVVIWMRSRRSDLWMLAADLVEAEFSPISTDDREKDRDG